MLSFFPRGVLDEILNLIESVSEGFPSYSSCFLPFIEKPYQSGDSLERWTGICRNFGEYFYIEMAVCLFYLGTSN